jgi:hypothetical protein
VENTLQLQILKNNQGDPSGSSWLFLRIYKLECILLHNTFQSTTVFSFYILQLTPFSAFDSRLYLDISRSFKWIESFIFRYIKVFLVSQMFTCGLSDLLSCGRFVGCFYIARIPVSSEHKLCQNSSTCIVSCIYIDQLLFLSKLLIFFNKAYYQELYILIIEFINVFNLAEW